MNIWTLDEFNLFVKTLEHKPFIHAGFHILFWCGLRIGELLALTFGDINFEKKTKVTGLLKCLMNLLMFKKSYD